MAGSLFRSKIIQPWIVTTEISQHNRHQGDVKLLHFAEKCQFSHPQIPLTPKIEFPKSFIKQTAVKNIYALLLSDAKLSGLKPIF